MNKKDLIKWIMWLGFGFLAIFVKRWYSLGLSLVIIGIICIVILNQFGEKIKIFQKPKNLISLKR